MTILTVGAGLQFASLGDAVAASHDGDTIYVRAGTYVDDFASVDSKITIVGVGGMVHLVAEQKVGKGMINANTDLTIDHFEFSGAKNSDKNGAGIRYQGGQLTVTNSYFHDNQDGLLGGGDHLEGNIVIDHTEFDHNGAGDGQSHNLYIAQSHSLTVTNSYLHDARVGHELKSRAEITTVLNNRIADFDGSASYDIDLGHGGVATIRGNYIQQGPNTQNPSMINYGGALYAPWPDSQLIIEDNIFVNMLDKRPIGVNNRWAYTAQINNNHFYGLDDTQIAVGDNVQSGNDTLAQAPEPDTSHPWAESPWDTIIWKGAADNTVVGTAGRDLFAGSSGSDTFVISAGGNSDTIAGFDDAGRSDVVRLEGFRLSNFAGVRAAMTQQGSDVVLSLGNGETLTFHGKTIDGFTDADFTFSRTITPFASTGEITTQSAVVYPKLFTLPESGASKNSVVGDSHDNVLDGTAMNDRLNGNAGADTMSGGDGDDSYQVDNANDLVIENENAGIDNVGSTIASYTLPANVENLQLSVKSPAQVGIGNELDNIITGPSGNDTLDGGAGNDILRAGKGSCLLTGGDGNDIFTFTQVGGQSTITDFHAAYDLIDLRPIFSTADYKGGDPLADHAIGIASDGQGGLLISLDLTLSGTPSTTIDLQGVAVSDIYVGLNVLWH